MKTSHIIFLFTTLLLLLSTAHANIKHNSDQTSVEYKNKRYYVNYTVEVQSSPDVIVETLTNYSSLKDLLPSVTNSYLLEKHHDYDLVKTHFYNCVLFFCKKAVNTQKIFHNAKYIKAVTLDEHSDFKYGLMTWEIENINGVTYIKYHAEIEPKFWVPPFIGPAILKHKLKKEANLFSTRIAELK